MFIYMCDYSYCYVYLMCVLWYAECILYSLGYHISLTDMPHIIYLSTHTIYSCIQVTMDVSKPNPSTPSQTHILCRYFNMTGTPFSDFVLQAAVPKYMKLEMQPPSSTSLSAYSNGNVTQEIRINNTLHGEKPVMLKLKIVYKVNGQQVCTMYTMFICCVN